MKVLAIHNRYRIRGGEDESHDLEVSLLRSKGIEVVDYIEDNRNLKGSFPVTAGVNVFWNRQAYWHVRRLIQKHRFDVMKVDNLFPVISSAALHAAEDENLAVVQTIRNFRSVCSSAVLFRDGRICEDCIGVSLPWPGIVHACYRHSRLLSTVVALSTTLQCSVLKSPRRVNAFIAASQFTRRMLIQTGTPEELVHVKPNFIVDSGVGSGNGGFALFVGRLTPEKGLSTLLDAWKQLNGKMPLKIVGDGPLSQFVQQGSSTIPGVEYLGRKPLEEVCSLMGQAQVLIFPSEWYETFGRTIVEAYAKGTPVIAARLGAAEELIADKLTGLLFEPGNASDLVKKIEWVFENPDRLAQMRIHAREKYLAEFTETRNYDLLMQIFEAAISNRRSLSVKSQK